MNRRTRTAALACVATLFVAGAVQPVSATLRTIERAYELTRNQVQLPGRPEGTLTARPCPDCKPVVLRVTPATAWYQRPGNRQPDGQAAVLAAFRAAATSTGTLVYVYYEPQTRRVKRIVLDVPGAGSNR